MWCWNEKVKEGVHRLVGLYTPSFSRLSVASFVALTNAGDGRVDGVLDTVLAAVPTGDLMSLCGLTVEIGSENEVTIIDDGEDAVKDRSQHELLNILNQLAIDTSGEQEVLRIREFSDAEVHEMGAAEIQFRILLALSTSFGGMNTHNTNLSRMGREYNPSF